MKKRTFAAILAVILVAAMLCGCSSKSASGGTGSGSASQLGKVKLYKALQWYTEDGTPSEVSHYDNAGHLILISMYDAEGHLNYMTDLILTDETEGISTAAVEAMDGVETVEVRKCLRGEDRESIVNPSFYVLGYNHQGRLAAAQVLVEYEGELIVYHTAQYFFDEKGFEIGLKTTLGSGEVSFERTDENTVDAGAVVAKIAQYVYYGEVVFEDGQYVLRAFDAPITQTKTCECSYY